jgi:hypothetical protein
MRSPLLGPRILIVLVPALNAALWIAVALASKYPYASPPLLLWLPAWGAPLLLALVAGLFRRPWAAFAYGVWSPFSAIASFVFLFDRAYLSSLPVEAWVYAFGPVSVVLGLTGLVVGLVVGVRFRDPL